MTGRSGVRKAIGNFFKFKELNTDFLTETVAGITTFMTMAYIIFVNPAMISQTGMDFGAAMIATCIAAVAVPCRTLLTIDNHRGLA